MKSPYPRLFVLLSSSLFFPHAFSQSSATVSIYSGAAFTAQRLCAIECILCGYGTYGQHDCIASALDCNSPLENSCYCRADLQPAAVSYVASCVSSACSNTLDVNSAVGIYTQYCATALQTSTFVFASTTQALTTTATSSSVSVILSTVTAANGQASTTLVTVTPTTGNSRSSGSQGISSNTATASSSKSDDIESYIGEAIGGVFIIGIAAAIITWLLLREKRKKQITEISDPPRSTPTGPGFPPSGNQPPGQQREISQQDSPSLRFPTTKASTVANPVRRPNDTRAGLMPFSPRQPPSRAEMGGPPRYTEHGGSERVEMQGIGRAGWELQG